MVLILLSGITIPAGAQTIRGTVLDSATSQPLPQSTIELLADTQVVARATTDRKGNFTLRRAAPGTYRIRATLIGYRPRVFPTVSVEGSGETKVELRLAAVPVELSGIEVEAAAAQKTFLTNHGFYRRKESERGTFLDPAIVERKATKAKLATDILIGIPGVSIYKNAPQLRGCRTLQENGDIPGAGRIFIDGVEGGADMMWSLQPNDILAIEVYIGPSQIPLQYGGTNSTCGVLLIWTKH